MPMTYVDGITGSSCDTGKRGYSGPPNPLRNSIRDYHPHAPAGAGKGEIYNINKNFILNLIIFQNLWERYFSSVDNIVKTTLEIVHSRI